MTVFNNLHLNYVKLPSQNLSTCNVYTRKVKIITKIVSNKGAHFPPAQTMLSVQRYSESAQVIHMYMSEATTYK